MSRVDRLSGAVSRIVVDAPDRLPLMLFWTGTVVSVAILADQFRPAVVIPLLAVTLAATWRLAPDRWAGRGMVASSALALTGAAVWLAVNLPFASRWVIVNRDPGFLALEGIWLSRHATAGMPIGGADAAAAAAAGFTSSTPAYASVDGMQYAQGAKLLPGLLAMGGWAAGDVGVLVTNLVIGALCLLAVYALARRLVGPWWALVPLVAMGTAMPLAAFSRSTYTEPLSLLLAFGGLTVLVSAWRTGLWWRYAIGAAMVGATALVRIDGAAPVIGLIAAAGIAAAVPLAPAVRRRMRRNLVAVTLSASVFVALGWLDLHWHSPVYLSDLSQQFGMLRNGLLATVAAMVVLNLPRVWDRPRAWLHAHRRGTGIVAACAVIVLGALLASRPWWLHPHNLEAGSPYARLVGALQSAEGMAVDPTRSYDDMSVTWLAWYQTWPAVVLAFCGLALIAWRAAARRDGRSLIVLGVVGAPSALYLWRVSITPDQIWAVRRFLPLTIPGFLIAAAVALAALWALRSSWARLGAVILAVGVAGLPIATWGPMFPVVEQAGRLGEIQDVCDHVSGGRVVYVSTNGPQYAATLRSVCDVEVIQTDKPVDTTQLTAVRDAWGGGDVTLVTFDDANVPWSTAPAAQRTTQVTTWPNTLSHRPSGTVTKTSTVWLGLIRPDGTVDPVAGQATG